METHLQLFVFFPWTANLTLQSKLMAAFFFNPYLFMLVDRLLIQNADLYNTPIPRCLSSRGPPVVSAVNEEKEREWTCDHRNQPREGWENKVGSGLRNLGFYINLNM